MNQEQILIIAEARRRKAQQEAAREQERLSQPPPTMDVVTQAPIEALASTADVMLNAPQNVYNLGKALYGTAAGAMGAPASALPEATVAPNRVTDYLKEQGFIQEMPNMTPQQRVLSSAVQGATGALFPGGFRQLATDVLTAGVGAGAGQAVTEATGNPLLGLATSVAAPVAGSRVPALNAPRTREQLLNQEYDKTINDAKSLGFMVLPEGTGARFAGQESLLDIVTNENQKVINSLAKRSIGFKDTDALNEKTLQKYRNDEYNRGYAPFKSMRLVRPDQDYITELTTISANPSYDAKKIADIIYKLHTRGGTQRGTTTFDPDYIMSRVSALRSDAQRNRKTTENADTYNLGTAQKALADALEGLMERQLIRDYSNIPGGAQRAQQIIDRFRQSRKNIAVSHVIEDAVEVGSGKVQLDKLASSIQKGDYLTGDLEKAAKFGNVYKPDISKTSRASPYLYGTGLAVAGGIAAPALGIEGGVYTYPLAAAGALLGGAASLPLRKAAQNYLTSKYGQSGAGTPDYTAMGINPRMALPASVGMFSTMQNQPEENQ